MWRDALKGYAAPMSRAAASAIAAKPNVLSVQPNGVVTKLVTQSPATWGLDRIDQRNLPLSNSYSYNQTGAGVRAYIIDTGVRLTHANFGGRAMAHVHVSWLDPHKIRKLTLVGDRKMAVFDDLEANEKLRVYDKGAQLNQDYNTFAEYVGLRFGDITIPHLKIGEPLQIVSQTFDAARDDGVLGQGVGAWRAGDEIDSRIKEFHRNRPHATRPRHPWHG